MSDVVHVEFDWNNEFGLCDDCGDLPASYWAPDIVFTIHLTNGDTEERKGQNLCPICAALWASYGEKLERLWQEEEAEVSVEYPKIRVYKRESEPDDGHIFDRAGFLKTRPWSVGPTPEDPRTTCYQTWEEAMRYATMSPERRAEIVEIENLLDGGW